MAKQNNLHLTVATPQELRHCLNDALSHKGRSPVRLCLNLQDSRICLSTFSLEDITLDDLEYHLLCDAVEKVSLPAEELYFDYEIQTISENKIEGYYATAPKHVINSYLEELDTQHFTLERISDSFSPVMNRLLPSLTQDQGRICLVYLNPNHILHVALIEDGKIKVLRQIPFETCQEGKSELMQTLRYFNAKSSGKQLDRLIMRGNHDDTNEFLATAKSLTGPDVQVEQISDDVDTSVHDSSASGILNLLRKEIAEHQRTLFQDRVAFSAALLLFICSCLLTLRILALKIEIKRVEESFSVYEYELAQKLSERLSQYEEH